MQIDLSLFCSEIRQAEPEKSLDESEVLPYLMKNLFIPFIKGNDVRLDSLDYDKFTMSDFDDLYRFLGNAGSIEDKLEPIRSRLQRCSPAARRLKTYC